MLKRFFPKQLYASVYEIDYRGLYDKGIRGLIFDVDNTLVTFDVPKPAEAVIMLFERLAAQGFRLCLLSNNSEARLTLFNEPLKLPAVHKAGKPSRKGVNKAAALMSLPADKIALIGDQMFTDVWCGNRCGVHTVLVKPIAPRDEWTVRLKRIPERFVMKAYLKCIKEGSDD